MAPSTEDLPGKSVFKSSPDSPPSWNAPSSVNGHLSTHSTILCRELWFVGAVICGGCLLSRAVFCRELSFVWSCQVSTVICRELSSVESCQVSTAICRSYLTVWAVFYQRHLSTVICHITLSVTAVSHSRRRVGSGVVYRMAVPGCFYPTWGGPKLSGAPTDLSGLLTHDITLLNDGLGINSNKIWSDATWGFCIIGNKVLPLWKSNNALRR